MKLFNRHNRRLYIVCSSNGPAAEKLCSRLESWGIGTPANFYHLPDLEGRYNYWHHKVAGFNGASKKDPEQYFDCVLNLQDNIAGIYTPWSSLQTILKEVGSTVETLNPLYIYVPDVRGRDEYIRDYLKDKESIEIIPELIDESRTKIAEFLGVRVTYKSSNTWRQEILPKARSSTKKAFAVQMWHGGKYEYEQVVYDNLMKMTIVLGHTLREAGHDGDIVVVTNTDQHKDEFAKNGIQIKLREMFDYPALRDFKCPAWELSQYDMQKIYYWSLTEYDKILALDNDIVALKNYDMWDKPEVGTMIYDNQINSGIMFLEPDINVFNDMQHILKTARFSKETGWNNCGPIGIVNQWEFQAANAAQGFIPYYFGEKIWNFWTWDKYYRHYAGDYKYMSKEYFDTLRRYGYVLEVPDYVRTSKHWRDFNDDHVQTP